MNEPFSLELLKLYDTLIAGRSEAGQMGIVPAEAHFSFRDFANIERDWQVIELAGLRLVPNSNVPDGDIFLFSVNHRKFVRIGLEESRASKLFKLRSNLLRPGSIYPADV